MRIEVAAGFALNVERRGKNEGTPLVLLHGFTGSSGAWGEFGELLAQAMAILAVDIVGHGDSDAPTSLDHYRMCTAAADVVAAVERSGFTRANWLGYSMGGRLALHVAAAHPGGIERLVLIGASPGIESKRERLARVAADELLASQIERDGVRPFIDYWESIALFASQRALPAETRRVIRAGRLKNSRTGLANSLRGMGAGAQDALHDQLAGLTMPALVLAGEADAKYAAIAQEFASRMPCARAAIVPGAGHAAQLEQPERCAAEVLAFLASTPHTNSEGATP